MRILQIVAFVGPGNPYGGPVTVAVNQSEELRRRGHDVDLIAARTGGGTTSSWVSGFEGLRHFRSFTIAKRLGFAGAVSPGLLWTVARSCRRYDVVHVHLGRDLVTLPAAAISMFRRQSFVVQTHGMVDPSSRRMARLLDRALTVRVLRAARSILCLTEHEVELVQQVVQEQDACTVVVPNGIPTLSDPPPPPDSKPPTILYASRLAPRKHPVAFAKAGVALVEQGIDARFVMVGTDEGEGPAVRKVLAAAKVEDRLVWLGPRSHAEVMKLLLGATALVLPSVDEPLGMIVLEALAAARPVIVTDTCGLASLVAKHECGFVVPGNDQAALVCAIHRLLDDPEGSTTRGRRGWQAVRTELGMSTVGTQLENVYADSVTHPTR